MQVDILRRTPAGNETRPDRGRHEGSTPMASPPVHTTWTVLTVGTVPPSGLGERRIQRIAARSEPRTL